MCETSGMTDGKVRRRPLAIALVAIASLLAYLAIVAIWVDRQALNTDNWTQASSQMLENPTVRNRVAEYMVEQLYANVDVEAEIREALPERAQPLAGPVAGAVRNFVERAANEVLSRPRAQAAWEEANRAAHELLVRTLEGGGPVVQTTGGVVVLDLKQLITELEARTGIGGRVLTRLPADAAQVTVLRSDQLELAQDAFTVLDALPIVSVVLSLALFGIALAVAPGWRRQAVRGYGFGLVAAGAAALATRSLAGDAIVDSLVQTEAGVPAAREIWAIVTELLDAAAVAAIFYGARADPRGMARRCHAAGDGRPARERALPARARDRVRRLRGRGGRRGAVVGAHAGDAQSGYGDPARGPVRRRLRGVAAPDRARVPGRRPPRVPTAHPRAARTQLRVRPRADCQRRGRRGASHIGVEERAGRRGLAHSPGVRPANRAARAALTTAHDRRARRAGVPCGEGADPRRHRRHRRHRRRAGRARTGRRW